MRKTYFVYVMSNKSRRLYVGITSEFQVDESWKAIPEAKFHPALRRQPRKS